MSLPSVTVEAVLKPSNVSTCHNRHEARGNTFEESESEKSELNYISPLSTFITTGIQSTHLARAVIIVNKMLESRNPSIPIDETIKDDFIRPKRNCSIFLACTSNIISSGVRENIRFLVKNKLIDCLVTTAGGVEEDLIKCLGKTYVGDFKLSGSKLRDDGINRVGNLLVPNDNYCKFEDWIMPIFKKMFEEQVNAKLVWSPSKIIERLGIEIDSEESICYWAAKNKIPVFCPAITDGSLGDMLHLNAFSRPEFVIDIFPDLKRINSFCRHTEKHKAGAIILGGGLMKHYTLDAMGNGIDYAVLIDSSSGFDGFEFRTSARSTKVTCDATIAFPLLVAHSFYKYANMPDNTNMDLKGVSLPSVTVESVLKPKPNASTCHDIDEIRGYTLEESESGKPELDDSSPLIKFITTGLDPSCQLEIAVDIVNEMLDDRSQPFEKIDETIKDEFIRPKNNCTIFLAYSSLTSEQIRDNIRFLVKNKMIDCLVTTAGGVEEDLIRCFGNYRHSASKLRDDGINRVGNLSVTNDIYCKFKEWVLPIFDKMFEQQVNNELVWSPSKIIERLGLEVDNEDSICYWAARNKIPIFCPAIICGSLGKTLYVHSLTRPVIVIDVVSDIHRISLLSLYTAQYKTGVIILGGGLPKHHTLNANLMRNGTNYAVYINTFPEFDGSDSGADPDEAVSWGKIRTDARSIKVACDPTMSFPQLVAKSFYKYANLPCRQNLIGKEQCQV